jgi:hypothetical protein
MFAQIIEQEAMKSYKATESIIAKISDGLQNPEAIKSIESDLSTIQKALACYQSDIQKLGTDAFYSELISDTNTAGQDLPQIKSALDKLATYS